ncbi:hypothetical protein KY362_03425, partial [Candidatus Woesearchaeota archaeon]|nr:hypothetical protein [Candidatus Woesearchaeota archaeon]
MSLTFEPWMIIVFAIGMGVIAFFWRGYVDNRLRGTFTHPTAKPEEHLTDIAHLINQYLENIYRKGGYENSLAQYHKKNRTSRPQRIVVNPSGGSSVISFGDLPKKEKWKINPRTPVEVIEGNIGRITLNRRYFTLRTFHHCFSALLAGQLVYLQMAALSGKDMQKILSDVEYGEKCSQAVLSSAGLSGDLDTMSTQFNYLKKLIGKEKKLDDEIALVLGLDARDAEKIEKDINRRLKDSELSEHVGMDKDKMKKLNIVEKRLVVLLSHEVKNTKKLIDMMAKKKAMVIKLARTAKGADREKWKKFLGQWENDMESMKRILEALTIIRDNVDKWRVKEKYTHHAERVNETNLQEASEKLKKEADLSKSWLGGHVDINRVEAILTSLTAARSRIIKELYWSE